MEKIVQAAIARMREIVDQPGSPWLKSYRNDFEIDLKTFRSHAAKGTKFLWVLREHGSDIERIGVLATPKESRIDAILNAYSTFEVWFIEIGEFSDSAIFRKLTPEEAKGKVCERDYKLRGREVRKHGEIVAYVSASVSPWSQGKIYGDVAITSPATQKVTRSDALAASILGCREIATKSGSLFTPVRSITVDQKPIEEFAPPYAEVLELELAA